MGPRGKRRRESSGLHQPSEGSRRLSTDDALAYLKSVKEIFKNNREKYDEFLDIMKAFKAQTVSTAGVIAQVRDLFKGHHSLILGFNTFLPEGYEITVPPEELPTNLAIKYADKVQTRFQNDEPVYKTFLGILSMYRKGEKSKVEVYRELEKLFYAHQDLVEEFTRFLPDCTGPTPIPNVPASARPSSGQMSGEISSRYSHKENEINNEKPVTSQDNFGQSTDVKDERISMEVENEHSKKVEKEKDKKEDWKRKNEKPVTSQDNFGQSTDVKDERISMENEKPVTSQDNFGQSTDVKDERISMEVENEHSKKVEKEKDKKEDWERKNEKPVTSQDNFGQSTDVKDERISMEVENEHSKKVEKEKDKKEDWKRKNEKPVTSRDNFGQRTDVKDERISMEVENEHSKKVEKEKDKKENWERKEKDKGEKISARIRKRKVHVRYGHPHKRKSTRRSDESIPKQTQTGQVGGCAGKQSLHTTAIEGSNSLIADVTSGEGGCTKLVKLENCREKDKDYDGELEKENGTIKAEDHGEKDILNSNASPLPNKDEFTNKPISELNLSNCECCTPSYRLLPKNYTKSVASYRTDLAAEVLNDNCVSVTYGSEDHSFKHLRKNKYEEILFRCEEDRCEFDVLIESTAATTTSVKELLEKMQNNTIKRDGPLQMEDYLTAINLRCIERIYGDHGAELLDLLRVNPTAALPVILTRLQQKQDEWSRCRADMDKVWAEVYAKNYHKSLRNLPITGASILNSSAEKV